MSGVADNQKPITYDLERRLQLREVSGGSSGSHSFVIHRIGRPDEPVAWFLRAGRSVSDLNQPGEVEVLAGSDALETVRYATEEERRLHPEVKGFSTWQVVSGFGPSGWVLEGYTTAESRQIIREALLAYRTVHGGPIGAEWIYEVEGF